MVSGTSSTDSKYYDDIDSSFHYFGLKVTIDGVKGNDTIYNGVNKVSINGSASNDYIDNQLGFRLFGRSTRYASGYVPTSEQISKPDTGTLIGGDGNDSIISNGANVIISGGSYTASASGNDIILKIGGGSITLKDTKGKVPNINGKKTFKPAWTLKKTTATYGSAVETLATVKGIKSLDGIKVSGKKITLNNSALKSKVTIGGGFEFDFAKDYTQSTISGSAGNDTLKGGKGNDSLWGSSYAESFIYSSGDGKDVIYGFDDKDTLTLDALDFTTSYSKKNQAVTFKIDNGSITLKDFTATTFNVNGFAYKIKGTNLVRK